MRHTLLWALIALAPMTCPSSVVAENDEDITRRGNVGGGQFVRREEGRRAFEFVQAEFEKEVQARGIQNIKQLLWGLILPQGSEEESEQFITSFVRRACDNLPRVQKYSIYLDGPITKVPESYECSAIADMAVICFARLLGEHATPEDLKNFAIIRTPGSETPQGWPPGYGHLGGDYGIPGTVACMALMFHDTRQLSTDEERLDYLFRKLGEAAAYDKQGYAEQDGMAAVIGILQYSFHPASKARAIAYLAGLREDRTFSTFEHDRLWRLLSLDYPLSRQELYGLLDARNALAQLVAACILSMLKDEAAIPCLWRYCGEEAIKSFSERLATLWRGRPDKWREWQDAYGPLEAAMGGLIQFIYRRDIFDYFVRQLKAIVSEPVAYGSFLWLFMSGVSTAADIDAYRQEVLELLRWVVRERDRLAKDPNHWVAESAYACLARVLLKEYPDCITPEEFLALERMLLRGEFTINKKHRSSGYIYDYWVKKRKELEEAGLIPRLCELEVDISDTLRLEFESDPEFPFGPLPPQKEARDESGRKSDDKSIDGGNGEDKSARRNGELPSVSASEKLDGSARGTQSHSWHSVGCAAIVLGALFLCFGIVIIARAFHR